MTENNEEQEKAPAQPEADLPRILFVWKCESIAFANHLAIFFEGIDMIVRVNRKETSVELLGFYDDED